VAGLLSPAERDLWRRMSGPDRRHAVAVARRVVAMEGGSRAMVVAALLHDVGKVESGLGTLARVGATLAAAGLGKGRLLAWANDANEEARSGVAVRVARYLAHDRIGAELLAAAGSDPLVVAWAAQHHLPADRWEVPAALGSCLKAADGD